MVALSWADLTYVLPATSVGYILLTLIAKFVLHENVTWTRWLGILFISAGVGFVTQGPALTQHPPPKEPEPQHPVEEAVAHEVRTMKELYTWSGIAVIVIASTAGDVLLSRAMKQVGDVGALWRTTRPLPLSAAF